MMSANPIPQSTLDASKHDDPAWWDECAAWAERFAAAALACRGWALQMRRGRGEAG